MSETTGQEPGSIVWTDLTVADAPALRDFYRAVVGWQVGEVDMGGYCDFGMATSGGRPVAGVCHARGVNADLPPQWLVYIAVADLDHSMERCLALGGEVIAGPRTLGEHRYCVVRDPAGAVAALIATGRQTPK